MNQESKTPITVEDLIRLKRAERPPVEFWDQFDRELRSKQLAALVEKRAWWHFVPRTFSALARYRFPLGATAALAVTFIAVREYQSAGVSVIAAKTSQVNVVASLSAPPSGGSSVETGVLSTVGEETPGVYGVYEVRDAEVSPAAEVAVSAPALSSSTGGISQMVSLLGNSSNIRTSALLSSGRSIDADLAAMQAAEPMVARSLLGAAHGFEARVLPAKAATVEPLAQMPSPSDTRRVRLQSAMAMMRAQDLPVRTGERVASQISDERLYDQTHRISGRGDSFSLKF